MRIVFSGAGPTAVITTRTLAKQGHEVIIIEVDIFLYRDAQFNFVDEKTALKKGDEVILLTHSDKLMELKERWNPRTEEGSEDGKEK